MSFIIGRGRSAREAYPERPAGGGGSVASLARGWADNVDGIPVSPAGFTTLASVTVTPMVTGKFRVTVTGKVLDTSGAINTWQFYVGHGPADPPPLDYIPGNEIEVPVGPNNGGTAFALVVDLDKIATPVIFPLGVPVRIAVAGATGNGTGTVPNNGVQIEVQEVF